MVRPVPYFHTAGHEIRRLVDVEVASSVLSPAGGHVDVAPRPAAAPTTDALACAPTAGASVGGAECAVRGCPFPPSNHPTGRCAAHLDAWMTRVSELTDDIGRGTL